MILSLPNSIIGPRPSYAQGFAPRDGPPMYPALWNGLVFGWHGPLGVTGIGTESIKDISGYGNHGTPSGMDASDWVMTQNGWALDFDRVNDYIGMGAVPAQCQTQDYSISCRFLWRDYVSSGLYTVGTFLTGGHSVYSASNGLMRVYLTGSYIDIHAAPGPALNTWHHLVITRAAAGGVRWWWNGIEGAGGTRAGVIAYAGNLDIGHCDTTYELDGQIHDFALYNRILTPNEVQQLYLDEHALTRLADQWVYATTGEAPPAAPYWIWARQQQAQIIGGGIL